MTQYYIRRGEDVLGPEDAETMKQQASTGAIARADEVSTSAEGPWEPAHQFSILAGLFPVEDSGRAKQHQSLYANEGPSFLESTKWFSRVFLQILFVAFWIGLAFGVFVLVRTLADTTNQPAESSVNDGNRPVLEAETIVDTQENDK